VCARCGEYALHCADLVGQALGPSNDVVRQHNGGLAAVHRLVNWNLVAGILIFGAQVADQAARFFRGAFLVKRDEAEKDGPV
jgi:hypothetical protein